VKATQAVELSRADDLLAQARALLLRADRATDLRTALLAVREARVHVELLSVTMRQLTTPAAVEPTQDAQEREVAF
jgi:hypothetical protein